MHAPTTADYLRWTFARSWAEREVLLLLTAFYVVVGLILSLPYSPALETLNTAMQSGDPAVAADAFRALPWHYWLAQAVFLLFNFAINVVWVRAAVLGRDQALDGGAGAFTARLIGVVARFLAYVGLVIVMAIILFVPAFLLGLLLSIVGGIVGLSGEVTTNLVLTVMGVAALIGLCALALAFTVAVVARCLDQQQGVLTSLRGLRGTWLSFAAAVAIVLFGGALLTSVLGQILAGGGPTNAIALGVTTAVWFMAGALIYVATAFYVANRSGMVPADE